ncbi:Hypothetical protein, no similarity [Geotrichum candidum]|uniref:Extracellular membrane protein CFEM domain-containing protein n=2 Tax=Geotrichum candidum TaxID=1173061 RepID=A0A0J9X4Y5_GEOCN|nr:Hypothetical protein, no similarity [Geotrichum candidum]
MKHQSAALQLSCLALAVSTIADAHILGFDTTDELVLRPATGTSKTSSCLKFCINHVARTNEGLCDHTTKIGCICSSPRPNVVRNQVFSCMRNCPSMEPNDIYLGIIAYNDICKSFLNEQNSQSADMAIEAFSVDNVEFHVRGGVDFNLAQLKQKRQEQLPDLEAPGSDPAETLTTEYPTTTPIIYDYGSPINGYPETTTGEPRITTPITYDYNAPINGYPKITTSTSEIPTIFEDNSPPALGTPQTGTPIPTTTTTGETRIATPITYDYNSPINGYPKITTSTSELPTIFEDNSPHALGTPKTTNTENPGTPTPGTPTPSSEGGAGSKTNSHEGTATHTTSGGSGGEHTGTRGTVTGTHTFSTVATGGTNSTQPPIIPIDNGANLMTPVSISMLLIAASFVFSMSG